MRLAVQQWRFYMFRLIKLAAYAVLGYIIYELWQGMNEAQRGGGGQRSMTGGGRGQQQFGGGGSESMPGMTGGGSGTMADVGDESGAESRRPVGRGVL
jgi:hypothetical protein